MSKFSSKIDTKVAKMNKNGKVELLTIKVTVSDALTGFPVEQITKLVPISDLEEAKMKHPAEKKSEEKEEDIIVEVNEE